MHQWRLGLSLALVAGLILAAPTPSAAKCCPLKYVVISNVDGDDIRLESSELEERLEDWEMRLLSWPVVNGMSKGNHPPPGQLGRGYLITYVHESAERDGEVLVRERIYPNAVPRPVAFTFKGQTQDWNEEDGRVYPVEWGWRPVQESIVKALFTSAVPRDVEETRTPWYLAGAAILLLGVWVLGRRLREHLGPVFN